MNASDRARRRALLDELARIEQLEREILSELGYPADDLNAVLDAIQEDHQIRPKHRKAYFAVLALLLASIGLYGVLSYGVTQRAREIGLRMALGASAGAVTRLVIGRGLGLTAIGLAIGLALAALVTRTLGTLLYGMAASDPATFLSVIALLALVSLAACSVPALRAARIDPMSVLRQE